MVEDEAGAFGLAAAGAKVQIGRYEVRRRLAVGGMAELFLARAVGIEGFRKDVVIKRMLPQYARHPQMVEMFLDEARIAGRLHHPNIAQVFDIGEDEGEYFFTMEYIHGEDVGALMRQCHHGGTNLPIEHAVGIAMAAAAGLEHAHTLPDDRGQCLNIVHRDVSPSNLMIGYDGTVKLVDFGIAKARERVHVTSEGGIKGKFAYMSPEQHRGEPLDRRSDIFSLGILLYEMATGLQLFAASSPRKSRELIESGEYEPPSHLRGDFPPELEAIIMRAMQREPEERYESASTMLLDLEEFAREQRLPVSTMGLSAFMRKEFAADLSDDEKTLYEARSKEVSLHLGGLFASGVRRTEAGTPPPLPTSYPSGTFAPEQTEDALPTLDPEADELMTVDATRAPSEPAPPPSYEDTMALAMGTVQATPQQRALPYHAGAPQAAVHYPVAGTDLLPGRGRHGGGRFGGVPMGLAIGVICAGLAGLLLGWFDGESGARAQGEDAGLAHAERPILEPPADAGPADAELADAPLPDAAAPDAAPPEPDAAEQEAASEAANPEDENSTEASTSDAEGKREGKRSGKRSGKREGKRSGKREGKRGGKRDDKNSRPDSGSKWDLDSPTPPGSR